MKSISDVSHIGNICYQDVKMMIKRTEKTNQGKWISGFLAFMLVFSLLFSIGYIAAESDHDCSGEDCPICISLVQCEEISRLYKFAVILIVPLIYLCVDSIGHINNPETRLTAVTPVSLKVQLNN